MKIGSEEHKQAFCQQFIDTYQEYDPDTLPWPDLDEAALNRLRSVPFWQEVWYTERRAGAIVQRYTEMIKDPVIKEAMAVQGLEETRHAKLIRVMIEKYKIAADEIPMETLSNDLETAFKDFGFGECMDSFLGFGVFKIAKASGFLPEPMFDIFEKLMFEETRHIVFFVNWMAYNQARRGWFWNVMTPLVNLRYYVRAAGRMAGVAQRGAEKNDGKEFSATQASMFLDGFNFRRFLEDCYSENRRRMGTFGQDLLRPDFLPQLADVALSALRLWQQKPRSQAPA
ncbi:MAG: hypothetical protein WAW96_20675 [Alphaproteobacteria bacterium]